MHILSKTEITFRLYPMANVPVGQNWGLSQVPQGPPFGTVSTFVTLRGDPGSNKKPNPSLSNRKKNQLQQRNCLISSVNVIQVTYNCYRSFTSIVTPFPMDNNSDWSKLKEFTDDNFKFDKKLSKRGENAVGKGEIVRYEQFLLFPLCFQKTCNCRHVKTRACLGKG